MTIQLTQAIYVGGVVQNAGTQLTLEAGLEGALVSSGRAIYISDPMTHRDAPAEWSLDSSGNPVGLVGPDGEIQKLGAGYGLRAVLYGHSYMDKDDISGTYVLAGSHAQGTATWANALLGKPFTVIKGAGVGGERIADILQRYDLHVKPYNPDIIFISMGHNDLNNVVNGVGTPQIGTGILYASDATQTRLDVTVERFEQVLDRIPSHILVVLLAETQPGRTYAGAASASTHRQLGARFADFNLALSRMALRRRNTLYVPVDLPIMDAASVNFEVAVGMYEDNVHPSISGAYKRGKMLAKYLERVLPRAVGAPLASNVGVRARPYGFRTNFRPISSVRLKRVDLALANLYAFFAFCLCTSIPRRFGYLFEQHVARHVRVRANPNPPIFLECHAL